MVTLRHLAMIALLGALAVPCRAGGLSAWEVNRRAWRPSEFPISFWCGPPEGFITPERYREVKEAGFTFVTPPCTWGGPHGEGAMVERNRAMLDTAEKAGLKVFLADRRMPLAVTGVPDAAARMDAIVADYKDHPALAGYSVKDEPMAGEFAGLAEVVACLREKDPAHPAWINLLPYNGGESPWGAASYEDYMRRFVEMVRPFTLSYDHYTFTKGGDGPTFIKNLSVARQVSLDAGIPFWNIVLVTEHGPYRNLTEGELRYEAMQTLAYGGKGLIWFTYWEPQDASFTWKHSMIALDGGRDPHYDMVKRVNWELRALGRPLLDAASVAVFHTGTVPMGGQEWSAGLPVRVTGGGNLTVGLFKGPRGESYALVANQDYNSPVSTEVAVRAASVGRVSPLSGALRPVPDARTEGGKTVVPLELSPGGAALLRW